MDPATLAAFAVAALVRYVGGKAAGVAGRAGRDIDAAVDGRLELALEGAIEDDPDLGSRLTAMLEDLSQRPPPGGVAIRDAGPVAGRDVTITAGRDAAGRDLTSTDPDER